MAFLARRQLISTKDERQIGADVHSTLERIQADKANDPVGKWAIEFLTLKKRQPDLDPLTPWEATIYVIADDKLINAFTAGGYTYISSGLILSADNCRIGGVMGHELTHVTERHGVKKLESAMAAELAGGIVGLKKTRRSFGAFYKTRPSAAKMNQRQTKWDSRLRSEVATIPLGLLYFLGN